MRVQGSAALMTVAAFCLGAAPALAEYEFLAFRSPTGNIHCGFERSGAESFATCEIREFVPSLTQRPANCELDWGSRFSVGQRGQGSLDCHGDTIQGWDSLVLGYGKSISLFGISCQSERSGMTCRNAQGGGFWVSRGRQRLF